MGVRHTSPPGPSRVAIRFYQDQFPVEIRSWRYQGQSLVETPFYLGRFPVEIRLWPCQDPFLVETPFCPGQFPVATQSGHRNTSHRKALLADTGDRCVRTSVGAIE